MLVIWPILAIKITHRITHNLTPEAQYIQCPELQLSALIYSIKDDFNFVVKSQNETKNNKCSWLCQSLAETYFQLIESRSSTSL